MTGEDDSERLAALFKEKGFVFSITIDPADMMRFALSCDVLDKDEICRGIVAWQYPTFKAYPGMLKSVEIEDNAECVVVRGYSECEAHRSKTINVTLDPSAFDIETFRNGEGEPSYLSVRVREGLYNMDGLHCVPCFTASFPSGSLAQRFGTRDFVLAQSYEGGFWDGSTALANGFALLLAPDAGTYRGIIEAQARFLQKAEK